MPIPELAREEYNAYRRSLLQFHVYELIFKEAGAETVMNESSQKDSALFSEQLEFIGGSVESLISEVRL